MRVLLHQSEEEKDGLAAPVTLSIRRTYLQWA